MYRIVCKFVPSIHYTPTGGQFGGAWRVVACMQATDESMAVLKPVLCLFNLEPKLLVVSSHMRRQPNAWCSPRKILQQWLTTRREDDIAGRHAYLQESPA